jgi:hypothetical protein
MFAGFDEGAMSATGISWKYELSALAMGFTLLGHQKHHFKVIESLYLPLAK